MWQPMTLADWLDRCAERFTERPFVITDDVTLSYRQVADESARLAAEELGAGLRADGDEDVVIHVDGSGAVTSIEHITQAEEEADKGLHDFVQHLTEAARDRYTFSAEFDDQAALDEAGRLMNVLRGVVEEEGKITAGMGGAAGGGGGGGPPRAGFVPDPGDEEAWNALAAAEQGAAAQAVATAARFLELANDAEGTTEAARYMTAAVRAQTLAVAASAAGVADGSTAWGALADAERNIGAQALDSVARFQELAGATELASNAAKLMAVATAAHNTPGPRLDAARLRQQGRPLLIAEIVLGCSSPRMRFISYCHRYLAMASRANQPNSAGIRPASRALGASS